MAGARVANTLFNPSRLPSSRHTLSAINFYQRSTRPSRTMSSTTSSRVDPKSVSEVAHQEGGTTKGSASARLQSQMTKERNAEIMQEQVNTELENAINPPQEEARLAESRVHRATGTQPPPGSTVAQAQSAADKEANFKQAVDSVAPKMQHEPEHITREDASLLHSADRRAHGTVEKGGVTSQAQHLASQNKGDTKS